MKSFNSFKSLVLLVQFILLFIVGPHRIEALQLTADLGPAGSSFFYQDFDFIGALESTILNGQTQSVDITFNNQFAVAGNFGMNLFIAQTGNIGTWPNDSFSVTGYLLDTAGNPVGPPDNVPYNGKMPAQVWPGWGYYLPDGTEYVPANTSYGTDFAGDIIDNSFYEPIIFSGIHFDLVYPNTPEYEVMGLRLTLSNYSDYWHGTYHNPIYVSPDSIPEFSVPEPSTIWIFGVAFVFLLLGKNLLKNHHTTGKAGGM